MIIMNKLIVFILGIIIGSAIPSIYIWFNKNDEYRLVSYVPSPNGERVGLIVSNVGGGGPGYCRDLIYDFPNQESLPDIHFENQNKEYLVEEKPCGDAKSLTWSKGKLKIN